MQMEQIFDYLDYYLGKSRLVSLSHKKYSSDYITIDKLDGKNLMSFKAMNGGVYASIHTNAAHCYVGPVINIHDEHKEGLNKLVFTLEGKRNTFTLWMTEDAVKVTMNFCGEIKNDSAVIL